MQEHQDSNNLGDLDYEFLGYQDGLKDTPKREFARIPFYKKGFVSAYSKHHPYVPTYVPKTKDSNLVLL